MRTIKALFLLFITTTGAFRMGNIECEVDPEPVAHSTLRCNQNGCKLECIENFKFPRGERVLDLNCVNRKIWGVRSYGNLIPECEATCVGGCKNGGRCIAPNLCSCRENFLGKNCEIHMESCPGQPKMPGNTMGKCVIAGTQQVQTCKVTCIEGFKFPDGTLTSDIMCRNGQWRMQPRQFEKCEPYCSIPCQNGGTCLAPNLCQCPSEFRGNQCQYSTDRCSPKKLGFNGKYRCTGDADKLECRLSCPSGFDSQYPLASAYICKYAEGVFKPQSVPQCDYKGMQVHITHAK